MTTFGKLSDLATDLLGSQVGRSEVGRTASALPEGIPDATNILAPALGVAFLVGNEAGLDDRSVLVAEGLADLRNRVGCGDNGCLSAPMQPWQLTGDGSESGESESAHCGWLTMRRVIGHMGELHLLLYTFHLTANVLSPPPFNLLRRSVRPNSWYRLVHCFNQQSAR